MNRFQKTAAWMTVGAILLAAVLVGVAARNGAQRGSRGTEPAITPSPRAGAHRR